MTSILTNNGAMVALQTLQAVNDDLGMTQKHISTGKEVGSAKDNAAVYSISKTMESDIAGFEAVEDGLALGEATVAVAAAGAEQIVEKLEEIKKLAVSAGSENVDHAAINDDITAKKDQITAIINAAQFNGANLLKVDIDGNGATELGVLASLDRAGAGVTSTQTTIDIAGQAFDSTSAIVASIGTITNTASAATVLTETEEVIDKAITGATALGAAQARLEDQADFIGKLVDTMTQGVSSMTDTNMEEASARLSALQTQQDLATQSLTIANQAPSSLSQLFR